MKVNQDANGIESSSVLSTCTTLRSGYLTATVTKHWSFLFGTQYDFHVETEQGHPTFATVFSAWDVPDLARLALRLAKAISADETVCRGLRDDLGCLAYCLGEVLGSADEHGSDRRLSPCGEVATYLRDVVEKFMRQESWHFSQHPSTEHVYRKFVALDRWLAGVGTSAEVALNLIDPMTIQHPHGVCPICAANDGNLNLEQARWFYCHKHQTRWCVGKNRLPSWDEEPQSNCDQDWQRIRDYRKVEAFRNPILLVHNI